MPLSAERCARPAEGRCCFCYGLFDEDIYQLSDRRMLHPTCLPALLQALEIESIELTDGTEKMRLEGWRQRAPWPA